MGIILITSQGKTLVWKAEDISAERTCAIEINAFTERYIEDLLIKQIIPIFIISDSARENVKSRYMSYNSNIFIMYLDISDLNNKFNIKLELYKLYYYTVYLILK